MYRKLGNGNLFLAYSRVMAEDYYPVPWTMWGGPTIRPGDHIGNIKIGSKNLSCPENFSAWGLLLYCTGTHLLPADYGTQVLEQWELLLLYCEMTSLRYTVNSYSHIFLWGGKWDPSAPLVYECKPTNLLWFHYFFWGGILQLPLCSSPKLSTLALWFYFWAGSC